VSGVAARVSLAAAAVLLAAWLGVLLRDAVVARSAGDRIVFEHDLTAAERTRELERLESARLLNPDPHADYLRASLLFVRGRPAESARVAESLVRAEPDSAYAWTHLFRATSQTDPARAAEALRQLRRLNPLGAARLAPAAVARVPAAGAPRGEPAPRP
jgi:hypothetical protein